MKIYTTKTSQRIAEITASLAVPFATTLNEKCYVFCEDKNTLSLETQIANACGGSFNIQVTSFSRYVAQRLNGQKILSSTGAALTVLQIMSKNAHLLKRLSTSNAHVATDVSQLIAQLKSAKVRPDDILQIINGESGAFQSKLQDVYTVYCEYEKLLFQSGIMDSNNSFSLIPELIKNDQNLHGAKVIISGYLSATRQIADVFEALTAVSDVDFVLIEGDGDFYTNELFQRVSTAFPNFEVIRDSHVFAPEVCAIEKGLFNPDAMNEVGLYSDKVRIFEAQTPFEEAELVARTIKKRVVENGARYKDFVIATSAPNAYAEIMESVFAEYEIPLYVDQKTSIEKHPLIMLILGAIAVINQNYHPSAMLKVATNRIFSTEEESVCFERYLKQNAVSRISIKKPFTSGDNCQLAEKVRKKIVDFVHPLKLQSTARDYTLTLRKMLDGINATAVATDLGAVLESLKMDFLVGVNKQVVDRLDLVFSEIENVVDDTPLTIMEYRSVLLSACVATEISVLPLYNDVVYMGDFASAKQRQTDFLFAIGLGQDVPDAKKDTALLTDKDLVKMEKYKCVIEPKIQLVNRRERQNVGVSLMSFNKALFLTYPLTDTSFSASQRSQIIDYFCKIFSDETGFLQVEKAQDYISSFLPFMAKRAGLKTFAMLVDNFNERHGDNLALSAFISACGQDEKKKAVAVLTQKQPETLAVEVASRLSASAIETYFKCPYSSFATYNLRLEEEDTGEARAFEFGNLLHLVFENFVKDLPNITTKTQAEQVASAIFDSALSNPVYERYLNKPNYKYLFELVKSEAISRSTEIFDEFLHSKFKPLGQEVAFGSLQGSTRKAIDLVTERGIRQISGKVDRIDAYGDYIRIVDYKTGSCEDKIKEVGLYSGTSVQLYLYSNAFLQEKARLAGVYYYKVDDVFGEDTSERTRFFGKTVYSEDVVLATDTRLETEDKSVKFDLGYKFTKKDGKKLSVTGTLTQEELNGYVDYAKKVCTVGATEMGQGFITPTPYEDACTYCKYGGMCDYDAEQDDRTRTLKGITKAHILDCNADDKGDKND